jgi:predicted dehydrogenase
MNTATHPVRIGIIGCGKISQAYFNGAKAFDILQLVACADLNSEVARTQAEANDCEALSVDALLAREDIDLVINLTIPSAHAGVHRRILAAGKHTYGEKPLAVGLEEGKDVLDLALQLDLRIGSAPDTFLGAGLQTCRELVDASAIGRVVAGTAFMLSPGPESWHPNPGFYYLKGGGPVFDMAPYYLTALVHLIGPVRRVTGLTGQALAERVATSEARFGKRLPVEVATHASATLEFVSGALITAAFSFDVPAHGHSPIELYGTEGSLKVPDPNGFGGPVECFKKSEAASGWQTQELKRPYAEQKRGVGVADMAHAIRSERPHRASGALALHVLEVMHAFDDSSASGQAVEIRSRPERPAALPADGVGES